MPARLGALDDERVTTGAYGSGGLFHVGDGHPHFAARSLEVGHDIGRGTAEGERHDRYGVRAEPRQLGLPIVIVETRLPRLHPGASNLGHKFSYIGAELFRWGRPAGHEYVHAEGLGGELPDLGDSLPEGVACEVPRCEETEPSRLAHSRRELGCGRPAGERRENYWDRQPIENHGASLARSEARKDAPKDVDVDGGRLDRR